MRETPSPTLRTALLLLTLVGPGCRSETERLFTEAERAEAADDYEGAARRLREITIGHPESPLAPRAQLELAQIHLLRTREESRRYAATLGQVEALLSLGRLEDAQARLREAARLSPDAPENEELQARLDSAASAAGGTNGRVEELEGRIHWGAGRAPRRGR